MRLQNIFFLLFLTLTVSVQGQIITTVAGSGTSGYSGDGGPAIAARMSYATGVAVDNAGNFSVTDFGNNVIRKVNSAGVISTFAGNNILGYSGDGGPANLAELYHPSSIAIDNSGNIYFTDQNATSIRKIDASGIITTITGKTAAGYSQYTGDGGQLIDAQFYSITKLNFDKTGNLYITDDMANVVRKVNSAGIISTVAGNGIAGFSGDGGLATSAQLSYPWGVAFDNSGNMFIADNGNKRVRKVTPQGIISTFAGNGTYGFGGDGGPALDAQFHFPTSLTTDNENNVYVGDYDCSVRKITPAGIITSYAGSGAYGYTGDGGAASAALLGSVTCVTMDNSDTLYICVEDYFYVIRKVIPCVAATLKIQSYNDTVCNAGKSIFSVNADNTNTYQWQIKTISGWNNLFDNTIYSGTSTASMSVAATINQNKSIYRCTLSNNCNTTYSIPDTLTVLSPAVPSITIVADTQTICPDLTISFTATATNGGTLPQYQWLKNGIVTGPPNSPVYADITLQNNDQISCRLISNDFCITTNLATSNVIKINVLPLLNATIDIRASSKNICSGSVVSFTSSIGNAGTTPSFQWFKNGIAVGNNSPSYVDSTLNNGDAIFCQLTSSYSCPTSHSYNSNIISVSVQTSVTPSVLITTPSSSLCPGMPAVFNAVTSNSGNTQYNWLKNSLPIGSDSNLLSDSNVSKGDVYSCNIAATGTCLTTSTAISNLIQLNIFNNPVVTLDQSHILCTNGNRILDAGLFAAYLWNDGSSLRTLSIADTGVYYVTVTDSDGCRGSDTAVIEKFVPSPKNFLPSDTSVCTYGSITLTAKAGYVNYLWNDNTSESSIVVKTPGLYYLEVTDSNNCKGNDSTVVSTKQCLTGFYIPSAFTPNNDGKNDLFKPIIFGNIVSYKFQIFNRWGQQIFETSNSSKGWDGNFNGMPQESKTYVWICRYQVQGSKEEIEKGTVVLIR